MAQPRPRDAFFPRIQRFLELARTNPAKALEPGVLDALQSAARWSFPGAFYTQSMPVAPDTIMAMAQLDSTDIESNSAVFDMRAEYEFYGLYPAVISTYNPDQTTLPMPSKDEILAQVVVNDETYRTQQRGLDITSQWVTLSALSSCVRLLGDRIDGPNPRMAFKFKAAVGPGIFRDVQIYINLFGKNLTGTDAR